VRSLIFRLATLAYHRRILFTDFFSQSLVNNDIDISAISHITYGNIPPEADKRICQFSYTKNT